MFACMHVCMNEYTHIRVNTCTCSHAHIHATKYEQMTSPNSFSLWQIKIYNNLIEIIGIIITFYYHLKCRAVIYMCNCAYKCVCVFVCLRMYVYV